MFRIQGCFIRYRSHLPLIMIIVLIWIIACNLERMLIILCMRSQFISHSIFHLPVATLTHDVRGTSTSNIKIYPTTPTKQTNTPSTLLLTSLLILYIIAALVYKTVIYWIICWVCKQLRNPSLVLHYSPNPYPLILHADFKSLILVMRWQVSHFAWRGEILCSWALLMMNLNLLNQSMVCDHLSQR